MANIASILGANSKNAVLKKISYVTQMIHYTQFESSSMQFYDFGAEKATLLADNIELAGAIHEPIIARQIDAERYEILSGHKRIAATKIIVEERGKSEFALVPAHIIKVDDNMAEYILISTNDYPEKSDYERMMEVVRLYDIIPNIKADEKLSARMKRRLVASETSLCETRVGNFTNIYQHLTERALCAFKEKCFGISVAIKIASLEAAEQNELVGRGKVTLNDINELLESKRQAEMPVGLPEAVSSLETASPPDDSDINLNFDVSGRFDSHRNVSDSGDNVLQEQKHAIPSIEPQSDNMESAHEFEEKPSITDFELLYKVRGDIKTLCNNEKDEMKKREYALLLRALDLMERTFKE